jgi:hypothetical protein
MSHWKSSKIFWSGVSNVNAFYKLNLFYDIDENDNDGIIIWLFVLNNK